MLSVTAFYSLERMTDKPTHTQHFLENSDFIVHMFLSEEL